MSNQKEKYTKQVNIKNKRAGFEYAFIDTYAAGLVLTGTEIKSIRLQNVNMTECFCYIQGNEVFIKNLHISRYNEGTWTNHDPLRERKLLLTKREIKKISSKLIEQGVTIVPTRIFINDKGLAKIEIAVAKGKKTYDKREDLKEKDTKRDIERALRS